MVKIIDRDGRPTIFNGNRVLGYVEDDKLYGLDREGYAVEVCTIDDRNDIARRFTEWQTKQ